MNKKSREDLVVHKPVTRSYSRDHNNPVSEQVVMADSDRLAERVHVLEQEMIESNQWVGQKSENYVTASRRCS